MKKQLIALLLAMSMVLSLAACGSKEETQPETEEPQVEEPAVPGTEEETEEPTEESEETEAPTEETEAEEDTPEVKPTEKPAEKPAAKPEQKPAEKPAEKPAAKPEQKPAEPKVKVEEIVSALKGAYGELYLPEMEQEKEYIETMTGLKAEMYDEAYLAMPMIGFHPDQLLIVRSANKDAAKTVKAYQEKLIADTLQYPVNQNHIASSVVYTADQYVIFFILGGPFDKDLDADFNGDEDAYTAAEMEYYKGLNAKGVAALDALFA